MNLCSNFMLNFQRPVVLGITETWLGPTVTLNKISISGYSNYRLDHDSRSGGVLVYVSHSCRSWHRLDLEDSPVEAVWFELRIISHPIVLCVVYPPPSSETGVLLV